MRFIWTPIAILITLGAVLAVFQNCTPAVPYGNTDYYSALVSSPVFPYEVGFDQMAYLSCSEQEDVNNDGTFFTFRVGAYNQLGLRINQTFRDRIEKVSDENIVTALQESQSSAGTRIQLAIRTMDNLQLMYVDNDNGANGLDGSDYNNFFPVLGDNYLTNMLWYMPPNDYLRFYAGAQVIDQARFEGRLDFMKSQLMENDLRTFFSSRGIITLTFAEQSKIQPIGPGSFLAMQAEQLGGNAGDIPVPQGKAQNFKSSDVNNLTKNVYGMAVQPRFKQPPGPGGGNAGPNMPPRVLSSITEVIIDQRVTPQSTRPWLCPNEMQFMIVLPEHATYTNDAMQTIIRCAMRPDPINPTPELMRIRQSLFAEDWYIDMGRKCIVPKPDHVSAGSCYGLNSQTRLTHLINYDTFSVDGCGFGNLSGVCPHYASICFRQ